MWGHSEEWSFKGSAIDQGIKVVCLWGGGWLDLEEQKQRATSTDTQPIALVKCSVV